MRELSERDYAVILADIPAVLARISVPADDLRALNAARRLRLLICKLQAREMCVGRYGYRQPRKRNKRDKRQR